MTNAWKHIATITDGEHYELNGLNLWEHAWTNTGDTIQVKDPQYQQNYTLTVYTITAQNKTVKFAAGEFSNCVWGIYQEPTH